jgi:hypothetical protein
VPSIKPITATIEGDKMDSIISGLLVAMILAMGAGVVLIRIGAMV